MLKVAAIFSHPEWTVPVQWVGAIVTIRYERALLPVETRVEGIGTNCAPGIRPQLCRRISDVPGLSAGPKSRNSRLQAFRIADDHIQIHV